MSSKPIGILSLFVILIWSGYGQQSISPPEKTLYEIEDHVYLFQGGGTWALTSIILEGDEKLTLVDTHFSDANNLLLIQQLKDKFPKKKLGTIVISHPHADHFMGVKLFKDAYGEIDIISIAGEQDHMRQTAQLLYAAYEEVSPDKMVKPNEIIYPNKEMSKDFTIRFSDRTAKFEIIDQNESWRSLIMYLPDTHLTYLGDLYWGGLTLDEEGFGASLILWEKELRNIMLRKTGKIIPGHGVGMASRDTIQVFLDDVLSFINTSKKFIGQGMKREDYIANGFHEKIVFFGGREVNLNRAYDEIKTDIENDKK